MLTCYNYGLQTMWPYFTFVTLVQYSFRLQDVFGYSNIYLYFMAGEQGFYSSLNRFVEKETRILYESSK